MLRSAKIDSNQKEIVRQLRCIPHISVYSTAQLKKFCDIVVGYCGRNYLFEIKKDKKSKLTDGESKFQDGWKGQVNIVTSVDEILKIIQ